MSESFRAAQIRARTARTPRRSDWKNLWDSKGARLFDLLGPHTWFRDLGGFDYAVQPLKDTLVDFEHFQRAIGYLGGRAAANQFPPIMRGRLPLNLVWHGCLGKVLSLGSPREVARMIDWFVETDRADNWAMENVFLGSSHVAQRILLTMLEKGPEATRPGVALRLEARR